MSIRCMASAAGPVEPALVTQEFWSRCKRVFSRQSREDFPPARRVSPKGVLTTSNSNGILSEVFGCWFSARGGADLNNFRHRMSRPFRSQSFGAQSMSCLDPLRLGNPGHHFCSSQESVVINIGHVKGEIAMASSGFWPMPTGVGESHPTGGSGGLYGPHGE